MDFFITALIWVASIIETIFVLAVLCANSTNPTKMSNKVLAVSTTVIFCAIALATIFLLSRG